MPKNIQYEIIKTKNAHFNCDIIKIIEALIRGGAKIGVYLNVVSESQELFQTLNAENKFLFHSRFKHKDRVDKENKILREFGKDGSNEGCVLISTQVAEKSINLDFDYVISQMSPIDSLLQRLGRLHRYQKHNRTKGFENPKCLIVVSENYKFGNSSLVYNNYRTMLRTQKLLENNNTINIPQDCRKFINYVFNFDERYEYETDEVLDDYEKFYTNEESRYSTAKFCSSIKYTLKGAAFLTRDGSPQVKIVLKKKDYFLCDNNKNDYKKLNEETIPLRFSKGMEADEDGYIFINCGDLSKFKINKKYYCYNEAVGLMKI